MGAPLSQKPNILLLFTDQQRADTIGAHGNSLIKTPVLDRLVREGTSFMRAYTASPVCVPARHALVTGKPPHLTGVVDNVEKGDDSRSMMEMLTAAGYQTHGVGKMHFCGNPRRAWGFGSRDYSEELDETDDYRKFLDKAGYQHVIDPHGLRSEYYYIPQPSQLPEPLHHTSWVADRSINFLKDRDQSQPFFLWSSFIKPHPPFETPNPWGRLYRSAEMGDPTHASDDKSQHGFWNRVQNRYKYMDGGGNAHLLRTQRAAYYASISFIDYQIGRILEALGDQLENTLIVFSSDHGEMLGDFGCFGKRCMLDPSVRVPLIARYPKQFAAGARCHEAVTLLDLFPTFASAAQSAEPRPYARARSLQNVVSGHADRPFVTSQFSQRSLGLYLASDAEWKYSYSAADKKEWLFHVASDPLELRNRIGDPSAAEVLVRLKGGLIAMFAADGYSWAVDGPAWRDYGIVQLPDDERAGLLFQDPSQLEPGIQQLNGYARECTAERTDWFSAALPSAMDPVTGRVSFARRAPKEN